MTIRTLRRFAAAALVLCTALPAWAQQDDADASSLAVQMYTLRNVGSLEDQLKIVHDAGIRAVETVGTQNVPAAELKRLLDKYGIEPIASHVALSDLRSDLDEMAAFHRAIGNTMLVVP